MEEALALLVEWEKKYLECKIEIEAAIITGDNYKENSIEKRDLLYIQPIELPQKYNATALITIQRFNLERPLFETSHFNTVFREIVQFPFQSRD